MSPGDTADVKIPKPHPAEVAASSFSIIGMLSVVSLVCGLLIVSVAQATAAPIARNLATITRNSVNDLVPGTTRQVIFSVTSDGGIMPVEAVEGNADYLIAAYDGQGALLGIVLEGTGLGYGGPLRALFAYSPDLQTITGYKVLDLRETPGLGDKIVTDAEFQKNFEQLDASLNNPIIAVRHGKKENAWEIDAISGATISSKAIARMVNQCAQTMAPVIKSNLEKIKAGK